MAEIYFPDGSYVPFPAESPNSRPDTDGRAPVLIILHSSGGSFQSAINWLLSKLSRVSAHVVISRTGEMRQLVSLRRVAYHAGASRYHALTDLNAHSIGIELAHVDGVDDWPPAQVQAAARLCTVLRHRFGIPKEKIVGHADICVPAGRKIDPYRFPWTTFRKLLG